MMFETEKKDMNCRRVEVQFVGDNSIPNIISPLGGRGHVFREEIKLKTHPVPDHQLPRKDKKSKCRVQPDDGNFVLDSVLVTDDEKTVWTPTALFSEDDISGQHMFGFSSPKGKATMLQKAATVKSLLLPSAGQDKNDETVDSKNSHVASMPEETLMYTLSSDEYFSCSTSKPLTSNNTLSRLRQPQLPESQLQQLLDQVGTGHAQQVGRLSLQHEELFTRWLFMLREEFSVVAYGLGAKQQLLERFRETHLAASYVVQVNGFLPTLTVNQVLDTIIVQVLENATTTSSSPLDNLAAIEHHFAGNPQLELFVILHNMDGALLRNNKSQRLICQLASVRGIHLVASVDHINTALMWDQHQLSSLNATWWDVTTLLPYREETSLESSMLVQRSGALRLASLRTVCQSLTTNAQEIFRLLAHTQLAARAEANYAGMPFRDLYWAARESLLVSSDLALRAQLTEFIDHQLVRCRRGTDGSQLLFIPVENHILQQFLDT